MSHPHKYQCILNQHGVKLQQLGLDDVALESKYALSAVKILINERVSILGGDVFFKEGVRRAYAANLAGNTSIPANIFSADGVLIGQDDLLISQLLSPKDSIDFYSGTGIDRVMNAVNQAQDGITPPLISVQSGDEGTPISDVSLDPYGDQDD